MRHPIGKPMIGVMTGKQRKDRSKKRPEPGRWTSKKKTEIVLRLLRGEDLDSVSREVGASTARLAEWRDQFLEGGQASLKSRPKDQRDEEIARLKHKVGEITMDNELLYKKIEKLEDGLPPRKRRRPW